MSNFFKMDSTQKMDFLLALYIMALVSAELLGSKVSTIAGVSSSIGIFALPITFTINDIVAEVYGKERASSFVRNGFAMLVLLFIFTVIATLLPPAARFASMNDAYGKVFAQSARIIAASLTSFYISEMFDVYVYKKIRQRFGEKNLWFRNNASNFLSQLFDTVLFMMLAFYTPGHFMFIVSLIWPYWLLKCAFSVAETPFTYLGVNWLRSGEKKTK
jgi:uncharacterized integral membrane protein (TIGR00697 family)